MEDGLDLGQLELHSTRSGLKLQLCSRAFFAPSTNRVETSRFRELIKQELALSRGNRTWVFRGQNLELQIALKLAEATGSDEEKNISAIFSRCLTDAKFWAQMHMQPVSLKTLTSSDNHPLMILSLAGSDAPPSQKLHRLNKDVPANDVRPPPGVETLVLASVQLDFYIMPSAPKKQLRGKGHLDMEPRKPLAQITTNLRSSARIRQRRERDMANNSKARIEASNGRHGEAHDPLALAELSVDSCWLSNEENVPSVHSHSGSNRTTETLPPQSDSKTCKAACARHSDTDAARQVRESVFLDLLDGALRHAILPNPKSLARGIRLTKREPFRPLSTLSPEIWSPGHLPAISSRSVFLPTISHALTSIGSTSKSASLRLKLSELRGKGLGFGPDDAKDPHAKCIPNQADIVQDLVSVRLWTAMSTQLRHQISGKRLGPLSRGPFETSNLENGLEALEIESGADLANGAGGMNDLVENVYDDCDPCIFADSLSDSTHSMLDDNDMLPAEPSGRRGVQALSNPCEEARKRDSIGRWEFSIFDDDEMMIDDLLEVCQTSDGVEEDMMMGGVSTEVQSA